MLAYWKLLMRDRLMALRPGARRREGQAAWKALLGWAGMALLFVILYGMAIVFEMLMYDQARAMGEPQAVIALAFLACTLMTLIYSFFYVISLLFFGRDCAFVGALPIPSRGVLVAKLATVLAGEIGLTMLVCLPLLVRYGVEMGMGAAFYVRSLLGVLLVPGIPVAITTRHCMRASPSPRWRWWWRCAAAGICALRCGRLRSSSASTAARAAGLRAGACTAPSGRCTVRRCARCSPCPPTLPTASPAR